MNKVKMYNENVNGCSCNTPVNGFVDDLKDGLNTTFFDEIFPKDSKGKRALVTRIELDTPSLLKIGAILLGAIIIFKKLK